MCLAIGSGTGSERKGLSLAWWRLAESPARLFPAGALFHTVLMVALSTYMFLSDRVIELDAVLSMIAGIGSLFAFGALMVRFPLWAERCSIHYMVYSSTFMAAFVGLLLIELHLIAGMNLLPAGMALLTVSLAIGLRSLWSVYGWVKPHRKRRARLAINGLAFTALLLAGLLLDSFLLP